MIPKPVSDVLKLIQAKILSKNFCRALFPAPEKRYIVDGKNTTPHMCNFTNI